MQLHCHQTHHTIADFEAIFSYLGNVLKGGRGGLHLFCECFLTGYPLADLCLQKGFMERYEKHTRNINDLSAGLPKRDMVILLGGIEYDHGMGVFPPKMKNVIYRLVPGEALEAVYAKVLLPNYDIFDEKKYYSPGSESKIIDVMGSKVGLSICEDMWYTADYSIDPVELLQKEAVRKKISLDLIINLSASPFHLGKDEDRIAKAKRISHLFGAPFVYVNRVGGEDGILFDGGTFIVDGDAIVDHLPKFQSGVLEAILPTKSVFSKGISEGRGAPREAIFSPGWSVSKSPPCLKPLGDGECQMLVEAILFGIREYMAKCGFNRLLVALSGGIDSSVVLALAKLSLGTSQRVEALYMPGFYSDPRSTDLVRDICKRLGVGLVSFPVKFLHANLRTEFLSHLSSPLKGIGDENIQSRLRGTILYTRSNQTGAMVLNTSNKSELAVGYSTLYGDSVGALSPLGDIYKTEVFRIAEYINNAFGGIIPEEIIKREPSAELRENQRDTDTLPSYSRLDPILEGILSYRMGAGELVGLGFDEGDVNCALGRYVGSEYKRLQFCPVIKLKPKSFGFGYRVPVCKK